MAQANKNTSVGAPEKIQQYAASASVRNLKTDSPDGKTCARMVKILAAGSFTSAKDWNDTLIPNTGGTPGTLGALATNTEILCNLSELISADAAFIAFW